MWCIYSTADYQVFINVIGLSVIRRDRETCARPGRVCFYVMQQMRYPHSKEAMNNCDNHCTMASFINVWGAQALRRLGCLAIFWSEAFVFAGVSDRRVCRMMSQVTPQLSVCFLYHLRHTKSGTSPCEHVHKPAWEWMISTVPRATFSQHFRNNRDFPVMRVIMKLPSALYPRFFFSFNTVICNIFLRKKK